MGHFRHSTTILALTAVTISTVGSVYEITVPPGIDPMTIAFGLAARISQTGGADSPTSRILLEGSTDKVTWFNMMPTPMALNDTGELHGIAAVPVTVRYVRARIEVAGGTPPTCSANAEMVADAPCTLVLVP